MSDIVTRLRHIYSQKDVGVSVNPETFTEAADEIERLRATLKKAEVVLLEGADLVKDALADRDRWKNWAEEYFYTDPDCECPLCDQVKAAINGG